MKVTTTSSPLQIYVELAAFYAKHSPCEKSKRGAVVFDPTSSPREREKVGLSPVTGAGFNGPPKPMICDGSTTCRRDCGKICEHAEARAIRGALANLWRNRAQQCGLAGHEILHVKVVAGDVVPGGPPSCWQCSRAILDCGIQAVWLFEVAPDAIGLTTWKRYTAAEFHEATLRHEKLHPYAEGAEGRTT